MKKPRVAVTGTTGRVGAALARHFARDHHVIELPRRDFDLARPAALAAALPRLECDVFLNPAGITGLEDCLDDPALAQRVNARAPAEIAAWAVGKGVRLIHFSTDYVLDGSQPGLKEERAAVAPLGDYARSKWEGERAVLAVPGTCVVRVSWVFGPEKASFIDSIVRRAMAGGPLAAIDDKFSLPTYTGDLAGWTAALASSSETGLFHFCNSGPPASWHDVATEALTILSRNGVMDGVPEIARQRLGGAGWFRAPRPQHTAMAAPRLEQLLGRPARPWRDALAAYLTTFSPGNE